MFDIRLPTLTLSTWKIKKISLETSWIFSYKRVKTLFFLTQELTFIVVHDFLIMILIKVAAGCLVVGVGPAII